MWICILMHSHVRETHCNTFAYSSLFGLISKRKSGSIQKFPPSCFSDSSADATMARGCCSVLIGLIHWTLPEACRVWTGARTGVFKERVAAANETSWIGVIRKPSKNQSDLTFSATRKFIIIKNLLCGKSAFILH